jgi:hypothetical protein
MIPQRQIPGVLGTNGDRSGERKPCKLVCDTLEAGDWEVEAKRGRRKDAHSMHEQEMFSVVEDIFLVEGVEFGEGEFQ